MTLLEQAARGRVKDTSAAQAREAEKTENERIQAQILDKLAELGGLRVQDDALIFEGTKFVLPANMAGRIGDAIEYLETWRDDQEEEYGYSRVFRFRPWDGAAAFDRAMKGLFGTTGLGKAQFSFFGKNPPQYRTIDCGPGETMQVPWGQVFFSPLNATFNLVGTTDPEMGLVFALGVNAPKKYRAHIEAFFMAVEKELATGSIYRGRAITAAQHPTFLNTKTVDPSKVIYSDEVMLQLDANIWSAIKYTDAMRVAGLPIKRQVLLYGPYGTGKTLAGMLTAQCAEQNGFTYIQVRPEDDLYAALATAQLYAPAVVMFEDIDSIKTGNTDEVAKLLDVLDGITNKGAEVMAVFTTNHPERLHKGMMRPGRLDAIVELAGLDAAGTRRLVEATIPEILRAVDLDWDAIGTAFEGLLPAFAKEAVDRAQRYAISRSAGIPQVISTEDLVAAAAGIRLQVQMMADAPLASDKDNVGEAFSRMIGSTLTGHKIVDQDGDDMYWFEQEPVAANGARVNQ